MTALYTDLRLGLRNLLDYVDSYLRAIDDEDDAMIPLVRRSLDGAAERARSVVEEGTDDVTLVGVEMETSTDILKTTFVSHPESIDTLDIAYGVSEMIRQLEKSYRNQGHLAEADSLGAIRTAFEGCFGIHVLPESLPPEDNT